MGELLESRLGDLQPGIDEYFDGISVFVTGSTGFIGKLLVEKLLRTCSNVKRVYILIRPKKGKTIEQRYEEFLNNVLLERINRENPKFAEKITLMAGDCALPNMGLNDQNQQMLIDEVNCIFHCAATVRFDEKIRVATNINVRATRDILVLCKQMKNLTSFVYVSTAYANCVKDEIGEELYDVPINGEKLLTLVEALDDNMLDKITPILIGKWPNTYVFTKAIAEEVVKRDGKGLPVAVVRPSIVTGTAKEPVPGWIDNVYGATGIFVGGGLGLIRTLHCDPNTIADMVPADFVINCTIAAAWNISSSKNGQSNKAILFEQNNNLKQEEPETDIPVYNYVSSVQKPINWKEVMDVVEMHGWQIPTALTIWYPFMLLNANYYVHTVCAFFMHLVPAYIADFVAYCIGKQPMLVKGYRKIDKFLKVLSYFTNRQWVFHNDNTQALWKTLNEKDQKNFDFNMDGLHWGSYFYSYSRGARVYLLKDPLDTIPQGKVKMMKLKIAHYILMGVLLLGLYKILMVIWNIIL